MKSILISIKPQYAELILSGRKTVELRKRRTGIKEGTRVIIYSTSPHRAIVGDAQIAFREELPVVEIWERHGDAAAIERREFDRYYGDADEGVVLGLSDVRRYREPITLDRLRDEDAAFRPPQSYKRTPAFIERLLVNIDIETPSSKTNKKRKTGNAQHLCKSAEHYTPEAFIEAVRYVLGVIDLDASSCPIANETVKAARFYSKEESGLEHPWGGRVYNNPPGDPSGKLVKAFWRRCCEHALFGGPGTAVIYAGFNVEQLGSLQLCDPLDNGQECPAPSDWPRVVVKRRIRWISGKTGEPGKSPSHRNFFCLLGGDKAMRGRFRERFSRFGCYEPPRRPLRVKRDLAKEIVTALASNPPMSKKALAGCIQAREGDVRRMVDKLAQDGVIEQRGKRWTVTAQPSHTAAPITAARCMGRVRKVVIDAHESKGPHFLTPKCVLERLRGLDDIDLDPCAAPRGRVRARVQWYGHEYQDGLVESWQGYGLVYCFPPPRDAADWARKIAAEGRAGAEIVALLPCRMDTSWLHDYVISTADAICYWRGSLRAVGEPRNTVTPRALCYWGPRADGFRDAFASAGSVTLRENVYRPTSWTLVIPRPSPVQSWIESRGLNSKAVKLYRALFAEELGLANVMVGCPLAVDKRKAVITRYGIQTTQAASLQTGGRLIVDILVSRGLLSETHGYDVEWRQGIDRKRQRTEIRIQRLNQLKRL